jgi:Family of unknown function (DUF5335)
MATEQLERGDWQTYFNWVSRNLSGETTEIQAAGLKLGDPAKQEWILLNGLAYDPKDDVFEIVAGGREQLIHRPQNIYVDQIDTALQSIDIIDADGEHHIVKLRQPVILPPS